MKTGVQYDLFNPVRGFKEQGSSVMSESFTSKRNRISARIMLQETMIESFQPVPKTGLRKTCFSL